MRDATLDVFGENQGIALLNHLNYTPRPIFQGYSAYSPSLINLNTAFYSSAKAPAYVLSQNQTIDGRYPTLDDAGVLKQLLYNYKPLFDEKGYLLWKRIKPASPIQPATAASEVLAFDSDHAIPANEIVWLELDIKKSFIGRLLGFLYRSPGVTISVTDALGRQFSQSTHPLDGVHGFHYQPQSRCVLAAAPRRERNAESFVGRFVLGPYLRARTALFSTHHGLPHRYVAACAQE